MIQDNNKLSKKIYYLKGVVIDKTTNLILISVY